MNDGCTHVDEEEDGDGGEDDADKVARQTHVDLTVPLKGAEGIPEATVVGCGSKRGLLLAKAWDIEIDAGAKLSFDLKSLDHRNDLALLFIRNRVVRSKLAEVLCDIVLHTAVTFFFINY